MRPAAVAIAVVAMLVIGAAFFFLAWKPLDDQETALRDETAQLEGQAQQLRNQLAQLQEIRDTELEIRADLNRLRALIPSGDPAQPSFVRSVQLAADASGSAIQSVTFGTPMAMEGATPTTEGVVLSSIDLAADVQGGYFQLVDLFRRLEIEVVRAVQVDSFTITESEDGFPELTVSMTGRIFAMLPQSTVTEGPAEGGDAPVPEEAEGEVGADVPVEETASPTPATAAPGDGDAGAPGGEVQVQ
ncbi:type 4a pilus biogenesis protein PilO [Euzebya sp.]|uniref:type 4a pilus biogenesis protein PilO n=1 Tax=Euzebya sp. TaxID=1971409 RepID=UPI00351688AA